VLYKHKLTLEALCLTLCRVRHLVGLHGIIEKAMAMGYKINDSPVGKLKLVASDNGLVAILWENDNPRRVRLGELAEDEKHPVLLETERQLGEYFKGKRKSFSLPLDIRGTQFQKDVWKALLAIPFGETRSYGQLAKQLGNPKATRAVGAANGRNPISIVVPCHRVIGSSGKLTGFAGGLDRKALLLDLEGNLRPRADSDQMTLGTVRPVLES
jgi:methylated-DNA-[protein]-cysteine S-methyltransferase